MAEIKLETRLVGDITGEFYVPSYQRGYRWGKDEVTRLLDDIYSLNEQHDQKKNYCLQPIVVRQREDGMYELIDGQQRLTTLYLIYKFMFAQAQGFLSDAKFKLSYETREKSKEFLENIDLSLKEDNVDFWFMAEAYETIRDWFSQKSNFAAAAMHINAFLSERVKVIWYEIGPDDNAISLFTRLNIGKIALTSAELVKAMFLSRDENEDMSRRKQEEISLQWDNIERDLHDDSLWYFLTNKAGGSYQTRIDLLLDLMADKDADQFNDKYYTFFKFDEMRRNQPLEKVWRNIRDTFLILKDWYENHELYHKVGYLISSNAQSISTIYNESKSKKKHEFVSTLDNMIRDSIKIDRNYAELDYQKPNDQGKISNLLLLFNVESVRQAGEQTQWFPFDKIKYDKTQKISWSLEHIHAQQSEGLRTLDEWKDWLSLHIDSVKAISGVEDALYIETEKAIEKKTLDRAEFESLQLRIIQLLSVSGSGEYLHTISNLALLNCGDNAALSNSTFDAKRNMIIQMDKEGKYIPFCTRMVFFKYYTPSESNQLHFWGQPDRIAYVQNMNRVLKQYLSEEIQVEKYGDDN